MKTYMVLIIGVVAVSFAAVFIRIAEAPPLVIAAYRMTLASIILLPFTFFRLKSELQQLSRRDLIWILLAGGFLALHFGLWIASLNYTSIASSVVLVTSHPAFVAVVSYFLWGERLKKLTIFGVIVALSGVVFINYGGFNFGTEAVQGNSLALMAALAMGAYLIIGGRVRESISLLTYLTLIYSCAAVILVISVLVSGQSFTGYSAETYLMMVLLALVPQLIGHSCLNLAVRLIPVTFVSVAILGEPIGAVLLGWLILAETPTLNEFIGGLLILCGIYLVVGKNREKTGTG